HASAQVQDSAARFSRHIVEKQTVDIEIQISLQIAQPGGKIRRTQRGVQQLHSTNNSRPVQRSFERRVRVQVAAYVDVLDIGAQQPQVQRSVQFHGHGAPAGKLHRAAEIDVGVQALQTGADDFQIVAAGDQMNRAGIFQFQDVIGQHQLVQITVNRQVLGMFKLALHGDIPVSCAVTWECLQVQ